MEKKTILKNKIGKTSLLLPVIFALFISSFAKGQETALLAFNEGRTGKNVAPKFTSKRSSQNGAYLALVSPKGQKAQTTLLQQQAAELKLESLKEYDASEPSKYFVVLKDKNSYAHVRYDSNGTIISTLERHQNAALPKAIQHKVALEYPDWVVENNVLIIKYVKGKKVVKRSKMHLIKGKARKAIQYLH